ncbi:MAG: MFS transporter [Actinobacteria bacterium]|nr:MFS transporter [Actinomycetota bacterium]
MTPRGTPSGREPSGPDGGRALRREIAPLLAGYWAFGQYWGVWVIVVYELLGARGISEGRIGVDYAVLSVFSVLAMIFLTPRLSPLAPATTVPASLLVLGIGAIVQAYGPSWTLLTAFALVGLGNGLIDVFMNVAAHRVEVRTRRPVLQWIHACYALGAATGSLVAGLLLHAGLDYRVGLLWAAAWTIGAGLWSARTASPERQGERPESLLSVSSFLRSPALLVPAFVVLSAFLVEGSMDTWSGLYLRGQLRASPLVASFAFSAFASAVFLGRLVASRTLFGLGYRRTILVAGVGSAAGGLIAATTNSPLVAGLGFLLLGFSLSSAAPAAFGLVEGSGEDPTSAIAAVTTVGYSGFIWSPPLLGWVAEAFSLRATMVVQVMATLGVLLGGILARNPAPRE